LFERCNKMCLWILHWRPD